MNKHLSIMLIASAMLMSVGGSAAPPKENARTEVSIQNDAAPFLSVEFKINAVEHFDNVVVLVDSNSFISVTTEKVLATCKVLAAPGLELESVCLTNTTNVNYEKLVEPTNSIFKDLPFEVGWCRC